MATLREFEKVFAPFSYKAGMTMEEHMAEEKTYTKEGIVSLHRHDEQYDKYSFKLDDGKWYSQFANNIPDEALDVVKSVKEGDSVLLKWQPSKKGNFRNFVYVEKIIQRESPLDEPDNGDSPTPRSTGQKLGMESCNAVINSTAIYVALIAKATDAEEVDPIVWDAWYGRIMRKHKEALGLIEEE